MEPDSDSDSDSDGSDERRQHTRGLAALVRSTLVQSVLRRFYPGYYRAMELGLEQRGLPSQNLLTEVPPDDARTDECPICLQALSSCVVATPCAHLFHRQCLELHFLASREPGRPAKCPLCRGSVHAPQIVEASSASGLAIGVGAVHVGSLCHFDRAYQFTSLGGFCKPGMLYVRTSNDDRKTPAHRVMWTLQAARDVVVFLNFRSVAHTRPCLSWLAAHGWSEVATTEMASCVTTGFPNGPYSGPVYKRAFTAGPIDLMGSNNWEGTYLVFVQVTQPGFEL